MNRYNLDRDYWIAARKKRRIAINAIAKDLSARLGEEITYNHLANWEYGKTDNPSRKVWQGIELQIREWRREDNMLAERQDTYGADFKCPYCTGQIPGPAAGANYCMFCGAQFDCKVCSGCGALESRPEARYCVACGQAFPE